MTNRQLFLGYKNCARDISLVEEFMGNDKDMSNQYFVIENRKEAKLEVCVGVDRLLSRIQELLGCSLTENSKQVAGKLLDGTYQRDNRGDNRGYLESFILMGVDNYYFRIYFAENK